MPLENSEAMAITGFAFTSLSFRLASLRGKMSNLSTILTFDRQPESTRRKSEEVYTAEALKPRPCLTQDLFISSLNLKQTYSGRILKCDQHYASPRPASFSRLSVWKGPLFKRLYSKIVYLF